MFLAPPSAETFVRLTLLTVFENNINFFLNLLFPEGRVFLEFIGLFEFLCEDTCDKSYVEVKYHNDKRLTGARFVINSS